MRFLSYRVTANAPGISFLQGGEDVNQYTEILTAKHEMRGRYHAQ